jgi:hypothetical protein
LLVAGSTQTMYTDGPERISVAEGDALLYLPGHSSEQLQRALRIPALSKGWQSSFQAMLQQDLSSKTTVGNPGLANEEQAPAWPGFRQMRVASIHKESDPEHNPMIPHTLVLKPGLLIYSIYSGYWFWGRPSVIDLWHDLRTVTSEIRPDWDLSAPGLREAWNAGDLSRFHGWNKRGAAKAPSAGQKE